MTVNFEDLKNLISKVKKENFFYNNLYSNLNLNELDSFSDFNSIVPILDKSVIMENLDTFYNLENNFYSGGIFSRFTSGTSNSPALFYRSLEEIDLSSKRFLEGYSYCFNKNKKDKVMIIADFSLSYVFTNHFLYAGCIVFLGNPFDLNLTINLMIKSKCNIIRCSPSIALKLADLLKKINYPYLEKLMLAGSTLSEPAREKLSFLFPNVKIILQYGMGETAISLYQSEKCLGTNLYLTYNKDFYYEFIDLETKKPLLEGEIGEMILTKLNEFSPLIRYSTGDLFLLKKINPDGTYLIEMKGRNEDQFKIKGITIFKEKVDEIIMEFNKYCTGEYQLLLDEIGEEDMIKAKLILRLQLNSKYLTKSEIFKKKLRDKFSNYFSNNFEISNNYYWKDGKNLGLFSDIEVRFIKSFDDIKVRSIVDNRFQNKK